MGRLTRSVATLPLCIGLLGCHYDMDSVRLADAARLVDTARPVDAGPSVKEGTYIGTWVVDTMPLIKGTLSVTVSRADKGLKASAAR